MHSDVLSILAHFCASSTLAIYAGTFTQIHFLINKLFHIISAIFPDICKGDSGSSPSEIYFGLISDIHIHSDMFSGISDFI